MSLVCIYSRYNYEKIKVVFALLRGAPICCRQVRAAHDQLNCLPPPPLPSFAERSSRLARFASRQSHARATDPHTRRVRPRTANQRTLTPTYTYTKFTHNTHIHQIVYNIILVQYSLKFTPGRLCFVNVYKSYQYLAIKT